MFGSVTRIKPTIQLGLCPQEHGRSKYINGATIGGQPGEHTIAQAL